MAVEVGNGLHFQVGAALVRRLVGRLNVDEGDVQCFQGAERGADLACVVRVEPAGRTGHVEHL